MTTTSELRPTTWRRIIDCVRDAGIDVSDWNRSANPSRCYAWSFVQEGKVVVLNLWWKNMDMRGGVYIQKHNSRRYAERESGPRKARARKMDRDVRYAYENSLPVRIVILDKKKNTDERAAKRKLDSVPWAITDYNQKTGSWIVSRGSKPVRFVDQYSADDDEPERRPVSGSAFVRNREVRDRALNRSGGNCEFCGECGFQMINGDIYLETHHIVPLSEGGRDVVTNVAALCANHHRQAHHGKTRTQIRMQLLKRISERSAEH